MSKVLLAFILPIVVFIICLALAEYVLSAFMAEGNLKTFLSFLAAAAATVVFVQILRILTRKPV